MARLLRRELRAIARTPALTTGAALNVAAGAAFVVLWQPAMPALLSGSFLDQTISIQTLALAASLPWVAGRALDGTSAGAIATMSAWTGRRPSAMLAARAIALTLALGLVVATTLPVTLVAQQIAAEPLDGVAAYAMWSLVVAVLVSGVSTACALLIRARIVAWLATVAVIGVAIVLHWSAAPALGPLAIVALAVASFLAIRSADGSCRYLAEHHA